MGAPYVWVRGNHDSLGDRRPRSRRSPTRSCSTRPRRWRWRGCGSWASATRGSPRTRTPATWRRLRACRRWGSALARRWPRSRPTRTVDVAVVHDGAAADEIDGTVPLVLSGHYHRREQHLLPGGTLPFWQGSTGASGLRGLEHEKPTPVRASVLYFDRDDPGAAGVGRHHPGRARAGVGQDRAADRGAAVPRAGAVRDAVADRVPVVRYAGPPAAVGVGASGGRVPPASSAPVSAVPAASASPLIVGCFGAPRGRPLCFPVPDGKGRRGPPPSSSRGPGRCPFKAVARVRIPLGARSDARSCGAAWSARHPVKVEAAGSNPVRTAGPARRRVPRPGSSVGTSVRLKIGRSAVRPRPWPPQIPTSSAGQPLRDEPRASGSRRASCRRHTGQRQ